MVFEDNNVFDLATLTAELDEELANGTLLDEVDEETTEDSTLVEEETTEVTEETNEETEETEEVEDTETVEEDTVETTEDNVKPEVDADLHKRNEAFKELRLEKERLAKEAEFVKQLADSYGMTVDEMRTRFEEDRAKKEAEAQGLNIEQYKKMTDLESKVKRLEASRLEERFNLYADKFIQDKGLTNDQFKELAVESTKMGFDLINNPQYIETAWKAMNYDKAIEEGKQKQLAVTKKRRETSTGNTGTTGGNVVEVKNYDQEIDAYLKEQGIID